MWFVAGIGGTGAFWYFLSQRNYLAAVLTFFASLVVVLIAVALHIRNDRLRRVLQTSANLTAEATPSVTRRPDEPKIYLQEKSPDEIVARIKSLNPLERDLVARQTYVGRWVRWSGTILSVEPFRLLETGGFIVTVEGGSPAFARLRFLPTEKHLVEVLQEGDLINYEAKITHVLGNDLYFTDVTVTQPEERTFVDSRPEDLTRVFEEHTEIQARTRVADAIGKWMKVSGPLGNVGDFTSFAQVTFMYRPSPHPQIYMYFRKKKWFDRVSVLNRGNDITVVGRISEVKYGELHLDNCELISFRE